MKKLHGIILIAVVLSSVALSCTDKARVIPVRKMEKIYREMFLADQWLEDFPEKKEMAETTWFYVPIFERYGYTVEDYRKSVDYYLNDPKRYADMIDRVIKDMEAEAEVIDKNLLRQERARDRADSIARALRAFAAEDFTFYEDLFLVNSMTDRINIRKNPRGAYFPVPVEEDTMFHGPELLIRDSASVKQPEETHRPIPWKD